MGKSNQTKPSGYWTKERVFKEAMRYTTKHLFYKGCRGGYGAAERNGWFDEMIWFEKTAPNSPRVWTKDVVFEFARQFETKAQFRKANKSAYNAAWKKGWLDEMNWLDASVREPYTKDEVLSIAKQFTTKNDFRKNVQSAYNIALKNGWLSEMTWFVTADKFDRHKYKSRGDFQKNCISAYNVANSNRWLDEMPWLKPQLKSWSKENVIEEALKYPSKVMFHNKSSVAYRVALRNGWMDEIEIITGWKLKSI